MKRQIIALGGGGFSMEPDNLALDRYILSQSAKDEPRVCFIPTASGDSADYIQRFYKAFQQLPCTPSHLSLFEPSFPSLRDFVMEQDILYVGGGSTRNMLALWREWKLDNILAEAYQNGVILAGLSAGANCWFEEGLTDPLNGPLYTLNGLGFLSGSVCPHFDGEAKRRPSYLEAVGKGSMKEGYGVGDFAAMHFVNEQLSRAVSSRKGAAVYKINRQEDGSSEEAIPATYLN
ncbi:peptidase E [Virgibacillus sp. 7505]|uniref:Type 1 glutamine amidotransferase-like domain-containing protein n=1 Tax=Virgibacillus sp. 7505 TaxID=2022548 RepID=UPI000BA7251F|nr:peptidase E [Virgibacillus sp. 7505]PAE17420.1 peptidase E [Virgibacillus sp. 7505]